MRQICDDVRPLMPTDSQCACKTFATHLEPGASRHSFPLPEPISDQTDSPRFFARRSSNQSWGVEHTARFVICLWLLLLVLALLAASLLSCSPDDDDDAVDGDIVIDDDSVDDDAADDDQADDDADDDDAGDDDLVVDQLLLIGDNDDGLATSWLAGDGLWTEMPIPDVGAGNLTWHLGPSLFVDGQKGHLVFNQYLIPGFYLYELSWAHWWLKFTPANGWQAESTQANWALYHNVAVISAPSLATMWAGLFFIFDRTGGEPGPQRDELTSLYRLDDGSPQREWFWRFGLMHALYMVDENYGLAAAASDSNSYRLLAYNGSVWQEQSMPAGFGKGQFVWFWLFDEANGYGIWDNQAKAGTEVVQQRDGEWTALVPPAGCETATPTRVWAQGDYAIVIDTDTVGDNRFWERRNGEWSCRYVGDGYTNHSLLSHALILRDGRVFVVGSQDEPAVPFLIEVTAGGLVDIPLPGNASKVERIHALGATAPAQSLYSVTTQCEE